MFTLDTLTELFCAFVAVWPYVFMSGRKLDAIVVLTIPGDGLDDCFSGTENDDAAKITFGTVVGGWIVFD